jgi:hypothetical protein
MKARVLFLILMIAAFVTAAGAPGQYAAHLNDIKKEYEAPGFPSSLTTKDDVSNRTTSEATPSTVLNNPDFETVKDFILNDPTSRKQFVINEYECRHFATDVNNNAEALGIRCAMVLVCFERGQHAVVAFDTTDRGIVYIEPQTNAVIHPEVGSEYLGMEIKEILIAW